MLDGPRPSFPSNRVVRDAAGKKQTLLKRLMDADQALFVEQQIERFLGIKDTYVQGELPR